MRRESATGATPHSANAIRLSDATQHATWSVWAIGLFQQKRLLEDIKTTMPHYPLGGTATMKGDDEWWARKVKEATVKSLKDDGIVRPPNRVSEEFEDVVTTLEKKAWLAKEAKAVKINGVLQADYNSINSPTRVNMINS